MRSLGLLLACSAPLTAYYGFSQYHFVDPSRPWHADGSYRWVAQADFRNHARGHVNYSEADASIYYTNFLNDENSLSWELGYDYLRFQWEKNPRFSQTNFNYLIGSLGYVSTALDRWRWIANIGFSVDAAYFDFVKSAVGHALLWGKYHFADCCSVHVGVMGWYGVMNGRAWPILGFDWKFKEKWTLTAIYPCDYSLNYAFDDNWSLEAAYDYFGGPYRNYPRRAHDGKNGNHEPIFMVWSNGVGLDLKFKFEHLVKASLGAGWNFGGWMLINDEHNRHGKYYHYNSAPYAQGRLEFTF
jgi:hypothetical protein